MSAATGAGVVHDEVVAARSPWTRVVRAGETLRIVDLEGNQAVDFLCYNAADLDERYSAAETIVGQGNIFLTTGTVLRS
ncbi:MAG TPA: urea carboxylase-associated family protein, partial [Acidimicrobiia bacterium]|nr:urea carboxylase-associated family protein [Acidimicrobiia bacterium]